MVLGQSLAPTSGNRSSSGRGMSLATPVLSAWSPTGHLGEGLAERANPSGSRLMSPQPCSCRPHSGPCRVLGGKFSSHAPGLSWLGGVWVWWTGGGRPLVAPWSVEWSEQAGTGGPQGLQPQCTGFRAYSDTKFSLDGRGPHSHLSPRPLAWWVLSLLHACSLVISAPPGQGEEAVPEASPPPWASKQDPQN